MLEHKFTTRYAELIRCEALRARALYRLFPGSPEYEEIYLALAYGAHCAERETTDAGRRQGKS